MKATEVAPDNVNYQLNLGDTWFELKRYDEAIAAYQRVLTLNKDNAEAHASLASIWSEVGHVKEAVIAGRKAVRASPDNASYWLNLGWYAYEAGELAESIEASRRAVVASPQPMAFFNLGLALIALGKSAEALEEYGRGLEVSRSRTVSENAREREGALADLANLASRQPEVTEVIEKLTRLFEASDFPNAAAPE